MNVGVVSQVHGTNVGESSEHSNVDRRSSAEKSNVAVVSVVVGSGPLWIVVTGGRNGSGARISHVWVAGVGSLFSAVSTARTSNVCVPTSRISLYGLVQFVQSCSLELSMRHWKPTLLALSVPPKRNVATSS